jgi:hypothetical protein
MSPSTNFLVNVVLLGLALVPIGFIVWGIALILGHKSTPELPQNVRFHEPGWVSAEAEIVDKSRSDDGYLVTYRFTGATKNSSQIYTKTQSIGANQHAALLKGSFTEVMYPPDRPNDAELVEHQGSSIPASDSWLPTLGSVVNGIVLPFVVILNLVSLGAFSQQGGPAPTSWLRMPMETNSNAERGWSYVIGGVVILLMIGGIVLATTSGQPAAVR